MLLLRDKAEEVKGIFHLNGNLKLEIEKCLRYSFQLFISPQSQLMFKFWLLFSSFNGAWKGWKINKQNPFLWWKTLLFKEHSITTRNDDENQALNASIGRKEDESEVGFILIFSARCSSLFHPHIQFLFSIMMSYQRRLIKNTQTINFTFVIIISRRMELDGKKFECLQWTWTMWIFCMRKQFMKPWQWVEGKKGERWERFCTERILVALSPMPTTKELKM